MDMFLNRPQKVTEPDIELDVERKKFVNLVQGEMEKNINIPHAYGLSSITLRNIMAPSLVGDIIETNLRKPIAEITPNEVSNQIANLNKITYALASLNPEVIKTVKLPDDGVEIAMVPENVTMASQFLAQSFCETLDRIKKQNGVDTAHDILAKVVPELFQNGKRPFFTVAPISLKDKTGNLRVVDPATGGRKFLATLGRGLSLSVSLLEYTFMNSVLAFERVMLESSTPRHITLPPFEPLKFDATFSGGLYTSKFKNNHDIKSLMDEVMKTDGIMRSALKMDKKTGCFLPEFDNFKFMALKEIADKSDEIAQLIKAKDIHIRFKPSEADKANKQFQEKLDIIKKGILDQHFADVDMDKMKWLDSVLENLSRSRMRLHLLNTSLNGFKLEDYIASRLFTHGLGGGTTETAPEFLRLPPPSHEFEIKALPQSD